MTYALCAAPAAEPDSDVEVEDTLDDDDEGDVGEVTVLPRRNPSSRTRRAPPLEGNDPTAEYAMSVSPIYMQQIGRKAVQSREMVERETAAAAAEAEAKTDIMVHWIHTVCR